MIAALLTDRCTGCNRCVEVCPANVFDRGEAGVPIIARAADCQTCFQCELYCQADALYVAPDWDREVSIDAKAALATGTVGQYRRHSGWDEWETEFSNDQWLMETVFRRAARAE